MRAGIIIQLSFLVMLAMVSSCQQPKVKGKLSEAELSLIKDHVENLKFVDTDCAVPEPAIPDEEVAKAVIRANSIGADEHFPYAALFVLKCYYTDLINIRQGGELGAIIIRSHENGEEKKIYDCRLDNARNSLAAEFFRLCGINPDSEGAGRSIYAYDLVIENRSRLDGYSPIKEMIDKIEKEQKIINDSYQVEN